MQTPKATPADIESLDGYIVIVYSYIGYICASSPCLYNVTEPVLGGFIVRCLGFKCLWNKQCKGLEVTFATLFKHVSWYIDDFSDVSFVEFCKWPWRMKLPVDGWSPKQNLNLGFIFFGRLGKQAKRITLAYFGRKCNLRENHLRAPITFPQVWFCPPSFADLCSAFTFRNVRNNMYQVSELHQRRRFAHRHIRGPAMYL